MAEGQQAGSLGRGRSLVCSKAKARGTGAQSRSRRMWGRGHGAGTDWLCESLDQSVAACNGRQLAGHQQAESLDLINA